MACQLSGCGETSATVSEQRCGDSVCDGPENAQNCPEDCADVPDPRGDDSDDKDDDDGTTPVVPKKDEDGEVIVGYVYAHVTLDRTPGEGDCGVSPWGDDPGCAMGIKIWWGQHLKILAASPVLVIPDGQDRWVITNHGDVTSEYGIDLTSVAEKDGEYQEVAVDFSPTPECSGTIEGNPFDFQVMGSRQEGQIELIMSANPTEHIYGDCAGTDFDQQNLTNMLWGWAAAISGDPLDLTGVLTDGDMETPGSYFHEFVTDTNPSPENRDHVVAQLGFMCIERESDAVLSSVACPWE
jgi:hypothetical protein